MMRSACVVLLLTFAPLANALNGLPTAIVNTLNGPIQGVVDKPVPFTCMFARSLTHYHNNMVVLTTLNTVAHK